MKVPTDDQAIQAVLAKAAEQAISCRLSVRVAPYCPAISYSEAVPKFGGSLPDDGLPASDVIEDLIERASPGLASMVRPRFFGWVIGASHPVGAAADWLVFAWGQNTGSHAVGRGRRNGGCGMAA